MFFANIQGVMTTAGGILLAVFALLCMVVIHELGHYTMGKIFKFKINEFAVGFGKPIFRKRKKNGEYVSLRMIPLGGYCEFAGEDEESAEPHAFNNHAPWKRLIVLFAGAFFNLVSAILIISLTFTFHGDVLPVTTPVYESAQTGALWAEKDIVFSVDGTRFSFFSSNIEGLFLTEGDHEVLVRRINAETGKREDVRFTVNSSNVNVIPYSNMRAYAFYKDHYLGLGKTRSGTDKDGNPTYYEYEASEFANQTKGVLEENYNTVKAALEEGNCITYQYYRVTFNFFDAVGRSFTSTIDLVGVLLDSFAGMFTGKVSINEMGGPFTVITTMGKSVQYGVGNLMYYVCLISANLAVFNLLPIPSLDGSRMLFTFIEWVRGKPVNRNVEGIIHFVGIIVLFAFAIFVDLIKLF